MKTCFTLIFCAIHAYSVYAFEGHNKGIYGDDNRRYISEASALEQKLGRSVFAQVPLYKMFKSNISSITFDAKTVRNTLNICAEEKFSDEIMLSNCTGFLVAPDLILTAGHCIKDKAGCLKNMWILDYDKSQDTFSKDKIVYCKEIVDSNYSSDYALIRLTKSLFDRTPLKIRRTGKVNSDASFFVIGHPLGLPKISADQAILRGNLLDKTFTINGDTYSGNSGSPVIDAKTSLVEGILIKGDRDFEMDYVSLCQRSVHCEDSTCKGEMVLRSTSIPLSILH